MEILGYILFLVIGAFLGYLVGWFIPKDFKESNDIGLSFKDNLSFESFQEKIITDNDLLIAFKRYKDWLLKNEDYRNLREVDLIIEGLEKGERIDMIENYSISGLTTIVGDHITNDIKIDGRKA